MARTKQATPMRKIASDEPTDYRKPDFPNGRAVDGASEKRTARADAVDATGQTGILQLMICVAGIYASFLTWAKLQEQITTIPYGNESDPEVFTFSIFLNTIQSAFAATIGYIYLLLSSRNASSTPRVFPSLSIVLPLGLVAVTSSLASPFGYASLKHVGYITFILAKSCKLVPVMALHVGIFRKKYPVYKYAVVALVTAGVAVFTLQHGGGGKTKRGKAIAEDASAPWGLFLLGINLLFDGLTNSTQDYINERFRPYSGSQMMCAQNLMCTLLTGAYLVLSPFIIGTSLGSYLGISPGGAPGSALFVARPSVWEQGELARAVSFIQRHPQVGYDVLSFAACGAIGQVFIFYTLSKFSSLLLVTITVTRKMLSMLISVVWFGHALSPGQWAGVALVFGGVGAEALIGRREKAKKQKEKSR